MVHKTKEEKRKEIEQSIHFAALLAMILGAIAGFAVGLLVATFGAGVSLLFDAHWKVVLGLWLVLFILSWGIGGFRIARSIARTAKQEREKQLKSLDEAPGPNDPEPWQDSPPAAPNT